MADQLVASGWTVLARNWRAAGGEIDLVVARVAPGRPPGRGTSWDEVRFVEIKARTAGLDAGLEAVGPDKQRRMRCAAEAWLAAHDHAEAEFAFAVAVVTTPQTDPADSESARWTLEWWDDAF